MNRSLPLLILLATACTRPASSSRPSSPAPHGALAIPAGWPFPLDAPPAVGRSAMVATDAPLATAVGVDVLRAGGNAIDAAIATAFALAVVYPTAGNVGGGGFIVAHFADGRDVALDFRETAPAAATRNMYLAADGEPTDRSLDGAMAAGVPGSVAGLWEAHRRFGTKPWAALLAPAIRLAENGFVVDSELAASVERRRARLSRFPSSVALFMPNGPSGDMLVAGSTWRNPELGVVLRRIAAQGPAGFYQGPTAELIVAEMRRGGGIITHQDLRSYQAKWRDPLVFEYRGHRVVSMPPPSGGGLTLALMAHILEAYDLRDTGWHSPRSLHLVAEAMRRAFAVRNHYLGDPDAVPIPVARLLSREFAGRLRASIDSVRATPSAEVAIDSVAGGGGTHTTHLSIVDRSGNAVALTTTLNAGYGSAEVVAGAGFLLNNEMDDFSTRPGMRNQFGLVQGEANAIAPGKRMLSAMTPTIVMDSAGRVELVTGASGGPKITTAVFQVMSNVLDYGLDIGAAVRAPRIHHQHLPDTLVFERGGLLPETVRDLEARGYAMRSSAPRDLGLAASILRRNGTWRGSHDPRVAGAALGY